MMPAQMGIRCRAMRVGATSTSQKSWTSSEEPRQPSTYTRTANRTERNRERLRRPAAKASMVARMMPPTLSSTVGTTPWDRTDRKCGKFDTASVCSLPRAQLLGGQVRRGKVLLGEPERLHELQPLTVGVHLLQLGVELADQARLVLPEDEA